MDQQSTEYINPLLLIDNIDENEQVLGLPPEVPFLIENDYCGEYFSGPDQENPLILDYELVYNVAGEATWQYKTTLKLPVYCKYCRDVMEAAAIVVDTTTVSTTATPVETNSSYVDSVTGVTHWVYDDGDPNATFRLFNNVTYTQSVSTYTNLVANLGYDYFKGSSICFSKGTDGVFSPP